MFILIIDSNQCSYNLLKPKMKNRCTIYVKQLVNEVIN